MLCNLQIDQRIKRARCQYYRGVFSIDTLPHRLLEDEDTFVIVSNLNKKKQIGSHFVTIVYTRGHLFYLDSLATPPEQVAPLYDFNPRVIHYFDTPIQSVTSLACGFYCIFFALLFDRVLTNRPVTFTPFSDTNNNDQICEQNITDLENE